jgi:hypothetical protein
MWNERKEVLLFTYSSLYKGKPRRLFSVIQPLTPMGNIFQLKYRTRWDEHKTRGDTKRIEEMERSERSSMYNTVRCG